VLGKALTMAARSCAAVYANVACTSTGCGLPQARNPKAIATARMGRHYNRAAAFANPLAAQKHSCCAYISKCGVVEPRQCLGSRRCGGPRLRCGREAAIHQPDQVRRQMRSELRDAERQGRIAAREPLEHRWRGMGKPAGEKLV